MESNQASGYFEIPRVKREIGKMTEHKDET